LPYDSPWTWIFCLIFQDLLYYIGHRAVHEAGFFWGLHTIHHSSEYYNLSTALRQAAIQDAGLAIYDVIQVLFLALKTDLCLGFLYSATNISSSSLFLGNISVLASY
jgi:sterol desaturase/sphingolipid hydroxylase (fatty acid hydroxylase superfamily)